MYQSFTNQFLTMGTLPFLYGGVLLLMTAEYAVKKYFKMPSLRKTPYFGFVFTEGLVRAILVFFALPMSIPLTLSVFTMSIAFAMPDGTITALMYAKRIIFFVFFAFLLQKAYAEWKALESNTYLITLGFGLPIGVLLYGIYTFMF